MSNAILEVLKNNDFDNEHVNYLIVPTIKKMKKIGCKELSIKIIDGKASFIMLPEDSD